MALICACALPNADPVQVQVVGVESLPGEGLELRLLCKLRVQNPNDAPIVYDGAALELDLNGRSFASGVSDTRGEVPRFGEGLVELPVTVPAAGIVRQLIGFMTGDRSKATYRVRGFLNTGAFGRVRFDSTGEIDLSPKPPGG